MSCYIDSYDDVVEKSDITLIDDVGFYYYIALIGPMAPAKSNKKYKDRVRNKNMNRETITGQIKKHREKSPGNKRWSFWDDFNEVLCFSETKQQNFYEVSTFFDDISRQPSCTHER